MDKHAAIRQRMKASQGKSVSQSLVSADKENQPQSFSSSHEASSPFVSCHASGADESSFHTAEAKSALISTIPGSSDSQNQSYWAMVGQYSLVQSSTKENSSHQIMNDSLISMSSAERSSQNWSWQSSVLPDTSISPIKSTTPQKVATPAVSEDPVKYLEEWEKEGSEASMKVFPATHDDSDMASEAVNVSGMLSPISNSTIFATQQYIHKIQQLERELKATKRKVDDEVNRRIKFEQEARDLQEHSELDISKVVDNITPSSHQRLVDRNKTLAKEVRFADQTCVELSGKNLALEREISVLREQLDHLRNQNAALQETAADSKAHTQQLQHKVNDLESLYSKGELELVRSIKEKEQAFEKFKQASLDSMKWELQCRFLQNQLNEKNLNADFIRKYVELESQWVATKEENKLLKNTIEGLDTQASDLKEVQSELQKQISSSEEEKIKLRHVMEQQNAELCSLSSRLSSTQKELDVTRKEASEIKTEVQQLTAELSSRDAQLEKFSNDQREEVSKLEMTIHALEKSKEFHGSETRSLQIELYRRKDEFEHLESHITQVLEEKRDIEVALAESQRVTSRLEKELSETRNSLLDKEHKLKNLEDSLAKADNKSIETHRKLAQLVNKLSEKANMIEAQLGGKTSQLLDRLNSLNVHVMFISSAIEFDSESSVGSLHPQENEDCFNLSAGSASRLNVTLNLEKMEEARVTPADKQHRKNRYVDKSPYPSTSESTILSCIKDVSESYSEEGLSTMPLSPTNPGFDTTKNELNGSDRFHVRPFFDNGIEASSSELKALRENLRESLEERNLILEQLKIAGKQFEALEEELKIRTKELNLELKHSTSLTRVVDELSRNQKEIEEYVGRLEQEKAELRMKLQEAENDLQLSQEKVAKLIDDLNMLQLGQSEQQLPVEEKHDVHVSQITIDEADAQFRKCKDMEREIENYKTKLVLFDSQLRDVETQLKLTEDMYLASKEESEKYKNDNDSIRCEKEILLKEQKHLLQEIDRLKAALDCEMRKSHELVLQNEDFSSKMANKNSELSNVEEQLLQSKKLYDQLNEAFSKTNNELVSVQQRHNELEQLTKQMKEDYEFRLSKTLQGFQADIDRLQSDKKALIDEQSNLKRQLSQKSAASCDLETKLQQVSVELEYAQKDAHESEKELQITKDALQEADEALIGLKASFIACNDRLASLADTHSEQQSEIERYRNLLEAADDLESAATARFLEAQGKLEQVQEERDNLQRECHRIAQELRSVKENHLECEKVASEKHIAEEQIRDLEEALKVTRTELEIRDSRLKQMEQEMNELNSINELEAKALMEKFSSVSNELSTLKYELKTAKEHASSRKEKLDAASEHNAVLESKVRRLRDHIREQGKKIIQWEEFHKERAAFLERIRSSNERTREQAAKLAELYSNREKQSRTEPRTPWTAERSDLQYLQEQLENELLEISKQLADVVPQFA